VSIKKEGFIVDENKRKHILFTAMKLFNEFGFHATPTSKIAKKAKVSVGTLFNYFPTKEDLIHAIYGDIKYHSKSVFINQIRDCQTSHDTMRNMWAAVITWGIENPEEFNYMELFLHSPFKKMYLDEKKMETFTKFRISILQSISPKTICVQYPEYSTVFIDNALHATINFLLENEINDKGHFINSSFELLWNGFSQK
jgi:AcrR family transcriptional regulator